MTIKVRPEQSPDAMPEGFTYQQVAERLNCTWRQVKRYCDEGKLGYFTLGRGRRITQEHIRDYIARNNVAPVAQR